ncbi:MAG: DegT/DnrJ/EryC1/StrS family aminotransferase [Lachnospiraceae bacterium]
MQFRDLKTQYNSLKEEIDAGIAAVLSDCNFISGNQVTELEKKLATFVGVKHCITCGNGTDALTMALMAWNIEKGDAVFVPDFTFFASGEVVSFQGATPIFVDVYKDTYNISIESLENAILKVIKDGKLTPKVIIAVDLFGLPANYPEIRKLANQYNLLILEDGAQGFGGSINEKRACSFGDISTTSFFPAKPLGCYGDGGAIFTNDDMIAEYLRSISVHGKGSFKYDNVRIGVNSRLDTLQAAILLPKLNAFENYELEAVNKVAEKYTELLKDVVVTPQIQKGYYSSWAQYCIQLESIEVRDGLQAYLKEKEIPSMIYYPKPMHMQEAFADLETDGKEMKNTIKLCDTVLSLPMHPYLKDKEIKGTIKIIKKFVKKEN